ncbi:MAG TPA: phosphotransferase [Roseiflexaceae bacterium]|nr:phosphotransferase [Roseiflexaceae bacterium]
MELTQAALTSYLQQRHNAPVTIMHMAQLGSDTSGAAALKAFGYGRPIRVMYQVAGERYDIVVRQVKRNGFGRERPDDRMAEAWLDYATFNDLPNHVHADNIVSWSDAGTLASAGHVREFLLVTNYASGQPYADDLLRIRDTGTCTARDVQRAERLAAYLAAIHAAKHDDALLWRRRIRDLVGHGEGIMGLTDSYPSNDPRITSQTLQAIEVAANSWRWRLKPLAHRLSQVHGDFHPFNVLFDEQDRLILLDRSRGAWGEPADDVSCMTINYLFFGLQRDGALTGACEMLYTTFWETYMRQTEDAELLDVIAPWFAWRALVLASPQWYPTISDDVRQALLTFAQRVMAEPRFRWRMINPYVKG